MNVAAAMTETLDPELARCLVQQEDGSIDLRHPLVQTYRYGEDQIGYLNHLLAHKRSVIRQAVAEGDLERVLVMHERPYRFAALREYIALVPDDRAYWKHVRKVWTETELTHQEAAGWLDVWTSERPGREHAMLIRERTALAEMPETFTIWRGANGDVAARTGLSWTTDRDRAVWFANRFSFAAVHRPHVAEATVARDAVFALILDLNENEVVVDPDQIDIVGVTRMRRKART
jgi:hypothetical protein